MTPAESFCPRMERLQGSHSILGWQDSRGIFMSWDGTTPGESFRPGMERLECLLSNSYTGFGVELDTSLNSVLTACSLYGVRVCVCTSRSRYMTYMYMSSDCCMVCGLSAWYGMAGGVLCNMQQTHHSKTTTVYTCTVLTVVCLNSCVYCIR